MKLNKSIVLITIFFLCVIIINKGVVLIENIYFKNLDINIKNGELVCVVGPSGSGKSYLLKIICNKINNSYIYIDNKSINEYSLKYKRNNIVCVFNDNLCNTMYPIDELKYYLNKINIDTNEISNRVDYFINYFKLKDIINISFNELANKDRMLIKILSLLIIKPSLICIDDLLTYLDKDKKNMIFNYIKDNSITLISVISDIDECLLFDNILVLDKGKTKIYDKVSNIGNYIDVFNELGLAIPFIYDINNLLYSYDLINSKYILEKDLVNMLWK